MIQLTTSGLVNSADLNLLTRQFGQQHVVRLPQLLHADLLRMIYARMEHENWVTFTAERVGREFILDDLAADHVLHFVTNTPGFLTLIERITQCGPIGCFHGRIYRMLAHAGHYDTWHDDVSDQRLVGMSISLSPHPFRGGVFQLREHVSGRMLRELPNPVQGDAILFRISRHLQHRLTPMEGTEPKSAFAGWFRSGERDFYSTVCRPRIDR